VRTLGRIVVLMLLLAGPRAAASEDHRDWNLTFGNGDSVVTRFHTLEDGILSVYLDVAPERLISIPMSKISLAGPGAIHTYYERAARGIYPLSLIVLSDGTHVSGRFVRIVNGTVEFSVEKIGAIRFLPRQVRRLNLAQASGGRHAVRLDGNKPAQELTAERFERAWTNLAGGDSRTVWAAFLTLLKAKENAVPHLRDHLKVQPDGPEQIRRVISELDSDSLGVRESSVRKLRALSTLAHPLLADAQNKSSSPEVRRHIRKLLKIPRGGGTPVSSPEILRVQRAVRVLERLGTKEARVIVASLAEGTQGIPTTMDAQVVLARMPSN
jgi:hypothetical protein